MIPEPSKKVKLAYGVRSQCPGRPHGGPDGPASVPRLFPIACNFPPETCYVDVTVFRWTLKTRFSQILMRGFIDLEKWTGIGIPYAYQYTERTKIMSRAYNYI